jgi:hypothetical protein
VHLECDNYSLIGEILCFIDYAFYLIVRFSNCNIQCITRPFTLVDASVQTPNARHNLSCVPYFALSYRLLPVTFPRCQNCAKVATGVSFSTPEDDEVDDSGILEIGNGMNEGNNLSNTNDNTMNNDHNDDLGNEDNILDEEGDDTTKSPATRIRGRQVGKRVVSSNRVALSLQHKVDIINFYESSKDST